MSDYGIFEDPYCHRGSSVLINKLGIVLADELEAFEVAMFSLRSTQALPIGNFDAAHYRSVHSHLFQDVYDWAGEYRTIRIAKGGSMFCFPEHIKEQMDFLFATLADGPLAGGGMRDDFIATAATFLADLNAIHPFREGNGRTQFTFLFLLGERAGHRLDVARIRPQEMLAAMMENFHARLGALRGEIRWICG